MYSARTPFTPSCETPCSIQHRDRAGAIFPQTIEVLCTNAIDIYALAHMLPGDAPAIPPEIGVRRFVHQLSPAVEYLDVEIADQAVPDVKFVIYTVAIGAESRRDKHAHDLFDLDELGEGGFTAGAVLNQGLHFIDAGQEVFMRRLLSFSGCAVAK